MDEKSPLISDEQVLDLIPQKFPFVMVGRLLSYSNENIFTQFSISKENIFVDNGIFKAPGMIENIAQTFALHNGYSYFIHNEKAPVGYIGAIKNVKLYREPKVGASLLTHVKILQQFMTVTLIEGTIQLNDETLMTLQMKTFLAPIT